jgi:hypothetical protein
LNWLQVIDRSFTSICKPNIADNKKPTPPLSKDRWCVVGAK